MPSPRNILEEAYFIHQYCKRENISPEDSAALFLAHLRIEVTRVEGKRSLEEAFNFSDELIKEFSRDGSFKLAEVGTRLQNDPQYRKRISELYTSRIIPVLRDDFKS
jgi:hypothetical protein